MSLKLKEVYDNIDYVSIKYDTYFQVYESLLKQYIDKEIILVEVGVFNGGSLFMWRKYLGPNARIIGIDLNPDALEWQQYGFEIHIGDQSSEEFWIDFYNKVGVIDVLIDDGGHTNHQQIVTSHFAIQNIKNGGMLIVEDCHCSYFRQFGNPSRYSFIKYLHCIIDSINSRSYALSRKQTQYSNRVYSVNIFESIVVFNIDSSRCKDSVPTTNNGKSRYVSDFRYHGEILEALFIFKNKYATNQNIVCKILTRIVDFILSLFAKVEGLKNRRYFKN